MEVLLTGNTSFVTASWVHTVFPEDHVLVTVTPGVTLEPALKAVPLDSEKLLLQLVETYEFDRIVYFSEYLTPHSEQAGELDRLRQMLQANQDRTVQFLYLAGPEGLLTPSTGKSILAQSAEALCRCYARPHALEVKILRLPYLYGADTAAGGVGFFSLFEESRKGSVHFDEPAQQPVYALCMEDLAELTFRIFDTWTPEFACFDVPVVFSVETRQLGEAMQQLCPGLSVTYGSAPLRNYPADDHLLRQQYGWFPHYDLLDDFPALYAHWQASCHPEKSLFARLWEELRTRRRLLMGLEILTAWVVTELLVRLTETQATFRVVDFRLMFVVLVGTIYGLNAGVVGAVLASVSLVLGYLAQGTSPILLFYEPSNWLAFIVYFVVGAVCGYVQLRNTEAIRFVQEECTLLRERLRFTRHLYQDTLDDKRAFRRQILGRRNSFGKIYSVTQQLDVLQPQELYRKTVQIMEDILDNHSLTVYQLDKNHRFARLTAACPSYEKKAIRSLELNGYLPVQQAIEQEGLWVNRGLLPGLPMYAAGVRQNGSIAVLIMLYDAGDDQLNLYYQNLFRILCGLVETALVRAFEYEEAILQTQYLPNTHLMKPEYFTKQLASACSMQEDKMASHLLLRVLDPERDLTRLSALLENSIRTSDIAGMAEDHAFYLLLRQADESALPVVTQRLAAKNIAVRNISFEEQLALAAQRSEAAS